MPEPLLPAAVRLTSAAETLAALAAHVRVETEQLDVAPRVRELLAAVAEAVTGSTTVGEAGPQVVGMARALLRESVALVDDPGRTGNWATVDEEVLQGIGRLSMAIAPIFALAAESLPGLGEALRRRGASFLDVGTGTGWLAIAIARTFPAARVVGIDVFEPALVLAQANVARQEMAERVVLRHLDVTALDEEASYDAIWLPLPFLPAAVVPAAVAAATRSLRPGGWLLPGTFAGPDDDVSRLLTDLRIVRSGGHPWIPQELVAILTDHGLTEASELPRTWPAPVRMFAARRPS